MIDFKKELEKFKPCMNTDEVEEAIYGSDLKDLTDIMREVIEEFRKNEKINENELAVKIKTDIKEELKEEVSHHTFLVSGEQVENVEGKEETLSGIETDSQLEKIEQDSKEEVTQLIQSENGNDSEEDKGGIK
ncbi:MAG: hypothetical protein ACI4F9_09460 [Lachnospiraceae bacterium]